jgi:hypothetical protein
VTDAASLDANSHIARAGLRNLALDDFKIAAGFGDLHRLHFWH